MNRPAPTKRLVDRLLASPHYGERMAMWWLDLVRYADTVGYHGDQNMSVSPFRDYVIDSFNANKPLRPVHRSSNWPATCCRSLRVNSSIASGYNRLGMMSAEGGGARQGIPRQVHGRAGAQRLGHLARRHLGCAECHDHKFDPVSRRKTSTASAPSSPTSKNAASTGRQTTTATGAPTSKIRRPSRKPSEIASPHESAKCAKSLKRPRPNSSPRRPSGNKSKFLGPI